MTHSPQVEGDPELFRLGEHSVPKAAPLQQLRLHQRAIRKLHGQHPIDQFLRLLRLRVTVSLIRPKQRETEQTTCYKWQGSTKVIFDLRKFVGLVLWLSGCLPMLRIGLRAAFCKCVGLELAHLRAFLSLSGTISVMADSDCTEFFTLVS